MTRFVDTHVFRQHRFSLGVDRQTGGYFLSTPVSGRTAAAEYEGYFAVSEADYRRYRDDPDAAASFTEDCRMGRNRGCQL